MARVLTTSIAIHSASVWPPMRSWGPTIGSGVSAAVGDAARASVTSAAARAKRRIRSDPNPDCSDQGADSRHQRGDDDVDSVLGRVADRRYDHVGQLRRLVRVVDAREARDLAAAGACVEALGVAPLALVERRVHEHLEEWQAAPVLQAARERTDVANRADQAAGPDHAGAREQARGVGGATYVLVARVGAEAEVRVQPVAEVVAVEPVGRKAVTEQRLLEQRGERRLAGPGQAGQPDRR